MKGDSFPIVVMGLLVIALVVFVALSEARVGKYKAIACESTGGTFVDGDCWPSSPVKP